MTKSIFGIGLIAVDHIYIYNGKREETEYLGTSGGGSVGNTLAMLSLLGHKCNIFGVIGNDPSSDIIKSELDLFRIGLSNIKQKGGPSQLKRSRQYTHFINESRNTHSFKRECLRCGEAFTRDVQLTKSDLTKSVKKQASQHDVIHIDRPSKTTVEIASIGAESEIPISVDLGFLLYKQSSTVKDLLSYTNLLKINEGVYSKLFDDKYLTKIDDFRRQFPNIQTLIISKSGEGVRGYSVSEKQKHFFSEKAIECRRIRDEGGAGDVLMALLIHEFLLSRKKKSKKTIIKAINRAQALASYNCTLYGSRSLQRSLLQQDLSRIDILNIADQIIEDQYVGNSYNPRSGIPHQYSFRYRFTDDNLCYICGASGGYQKKIKSRTKRKKASKHIDDTSRFLYDMSSAFESGLLNKDNIMRFEKKPLLLIGSGGSLSAATFGEQLLIKSLGIPARAIPPYHVELIKKVSNKYPICLLSYGGNNPDILGVAYKLANDGISNCMVLCGDTKSKLFQFAKKRKWVLIELPGQNRSFVSTIGMLTMVSILIAFFSPKSELINIKNRFEAKNLMTLLNSGNFVTKQLCRKLIATDKNLHIIGLASGWGWAALVDFESRMVEGGICTVEIAELKNFTHGRYINAFHNKENRGIVIFETPEDRELSTFIQSRFRRFIKPIIVISTDYHGIVGSLDLIIKSLFFSWNFGSLRGKDITSPKYPQEARGLYGWQPKYRKGKEYEEIKYNDL